MHDVRFLYLLHVRDVRCTACGMAAIDASSARPHLRIAVGANHRPLRFPAIDRLPTALLLTVQCACGREVLYGTPDDAVPLLSSRRPPPFLAFATYVLAGVDGLPP